MDPQLHNRSVQNKAVGSLDDLNQQLHMSFSNHLRQVCGHLVRIRNRKIYLVHQTARDILLKSQLAGRTATAALSLKATSPPVNLLESSRSRWRHSITMENANMYLLQVCANYLILFTSEPTACGKWTCQMVRQHLRECKKDPPRGLFQYAVNHWTKHCQPVRKQESQGHTFDILLDSLIPYFKTWIIVHPSFALGQEELEIGPGRSAIWIDRAKRLSNAEHDTPEDSHQVYEQQHSPAERSTLRKDQVLDYFFFHGAGHGTFRQ